jgi:hypothetical protein
MSDLLDSPAHAAAGLPWYVAEAVDAPGKPDDAPSADLPTKRVRDDLAGPPREFEPLAAQSEGKFGDGRGGSGLCDEGCQEIAQLDPLKP